MYYTVYMVINKINGKVYIGKHQTKNLDDGYMGSGKLIGAAIEKYGLENFTKTILHIFDTEQEMNLKEKELVTEEFCVSNENYNLCSGGKGGFGYLNTHPKRSEWSKRGGKNAAKISNIVDNMKHKSKEELSESAIKGRDTKRKLYGEDYYRQINIGIKKSEIHREKIRKSLFGKKHNKIKCPYCDLYGGSRAMKRYHFENCKHYGRADGCS